MLKKRYLFLIIIVCLFTVSAVSAAEISNETNIVVNDDSGLIAESMDENVLSTYLNEEEIQGSADNGTFTALQKKIDDAEEGSTIVLENNYTYNSGFSNYGIIIDKALTINGNGYVIDALGQSRIFNINSTSITFENITFKWFFRG